MNRRTTLAAVALPVALVAGGLTLVTGGDSADGTVSAYFADVDSLIPGNEVKANGVEVGTVSDVRLVEGKALVEMELDPAVLPLHQDARATIRPVSLLGEQYVSLDTGSPGKPALTGPIPARSTGSSVGVDQVLNTLDTPTSTALGALVTTLGEGIEGNGGNVASTLRALAPALEDTDRLLGILQDQNDVLDELIDQAAPVSRALADDDGRTVDRLVGSATDVLTAISDKQDALAPALAALPQTLADARRTLAQLDGVASNATPALKAARPVTDNLAAISAELDAFARAGTPAIESLRPVLDRAADLLEEARPVAAQLRASGGDLRSIGKDGRRLGVAALDNLSSLLRFISGWALATAGYDGLGHFFRGAIPIDSNTLKLLAPDLLRNPLAAPPEPAAPAKKPGKKRGPVKLPDAGELVGGLLDTLLSATGLDQDQEQGLLGQLLGGAS